MSKIERAIGIGLTTAALSGTVYAGEKQPTAPTIDADLDVVTETKNYADEFLGSLDAELTKKFSELRFGSIQDGGLQVKHEGRQICTINKGTKPRGTTLDTKYYLILWMTENIPVTPSNLDSALYAENEKDSLKKYLEKNLQVLLPELKKPRASEVEEY